MTFEEENNIVANLSGEIKLDGQPIVRLHAQRINDSDSSVTIYILSMDEYIYNKQECDKHIEAFKIHAQKL